MESLADLLAAQTAGGYTNPYVPNGAPGTPGGMPGGMGMGMAGLGLQAMKNIQSMQPAPAPVVQPGGAGIAPRGQQVQLKNGQMQADTIDPRLQAGLAALLFGGR